MTSKKRSPVTVIGLMMAITVIGKLMGLWRDRLLTIHYGTGMDANAFLMASRIPRVFFDVIFASAIAACFIPVFNEYLTKGGKEAALRFSGNFITVIAIITSALAALGVLFAGPLTAFFADGYDDATMALCVELTQIMFPTILFTGIAFSFVGILQSFDEFNIPALISVASNGFIIVYYYTLNDRFGILGLSVAFLLSWLLQVLIQTPSLKKKGFRFYPSAAFRSEGMKKVFALVLPVMVSTWVLPVNQIVNAKFGSRLFDGAGVAAIELSYNLYLIIVGIFVLSVTNFIFPRMSKQMAAADTDGFRHTVQATMHTSLYVVLPMMAGLMLMARPLVAFVYGGGQFDAFSIDITARALFFVALGMIGYAVQAVISRAFFAEQKGVVPLVAGMIAIVVNIVLCLMLSQRFNVAGLAVASAVSCTVNAFILVLPLHRRGLGFWDKSFCLDMLRVIAATLCMAAAVYGTGQLLDGVEAGVAKATELFVPVCVGIIVYFLATLLLGVKESKLALSLLGKIKKMK